MRRIAEASLLVTAALAAGCASMSLDRMQSKSTILEDTLRNYAATIRWGDVVQAEAFVDPEVRQKHPLSDLDAARYKQVQVTAYDDQPAVPVSETEVRQTVEIGLVNVHTQTARSIVDHQTWRWDEKQKRWWLESGLPDITRDH